MDISKVIQFKYPGTQWSIGETYESLIWHSTEVSKPTLEEIELAALEYEDFKASKAYIDLRKAEYPKLEDQLDMIYHDKINGTGIWQATIANIKAKYPKPE